ncbi:MAG TPA: mechanosensitive ion channel [Candidatus Hydrogenedentes bacterium]|nr:mechanosensitive ion channel [Candidatus Hydrogenedentota bacterium]
MYRSVLAAAMAILTAGALWAQPSTEGAPDLASVEAQRKSIAEAQGMEESLRARVLEQYDEAIRQLQTARDWQSKAGYFEQSQKRAPEESKGLEDYLSKPPEVQPVQIPEKADLPQLERLLSQAEAQYKSLQTEFGQLIREPGRRTDRRNEIASLQAAAQQHIQEGQNKLNAAPETADAPELASARRVALEARIEAARQEAAAYEKEVSCYDARGSMLSLLQEASKRRLAQAENEYKAYRDAVAEQRRKEAMKAAEDARRVLMELTKDDPSIQSRATKLAEDNTKLAEQRMGEEGLTERIESANATLEKERGRIKQIEEQYNRVLDRVKMSGLDSAVGVMLRKQKALLPSIRDLKRQIRDRKAEISQIQQVQSDKREQRLGLADVESELYKAVTALGPRSPESVSKDIQKRLSGLIKDQRELIDSIQRDCEAYLNIAFEINACQERLITQTRQFTDYINENILWIGATSPLGVNTLVETKDAVLWLVSPSAWIQLPELLKDDFLDDMELIVPALAVLLAWLVMSRRVRARIVALGVEAKKKRQTRFVQTLETVGLTVMAAGFWPAVLGFAAWRLGSAGETVDQIRCVSAGLLSVALIALCFQVLRTVLLPGGLAEAHFGWPEKRVAAGRRELMLLSFVLLPLTFVVVTFESQASEYWKDAAGRIGFTLSMLALAAGLYRLFSIMRMGFQEVRRGAWLSERSWLLWVMHLTLTGVPAVLAVLALGGYYFTALHLSSRFFWTLVFVLLVLLAVGLIRRWLLLARRALAIDQAQRRREAMKGESEEPLDEQLDIVRLDTQTQTLLRYATALVILVGIWGIWVDVIPALSVFDKIRLWEITVSAEEQVQGAEDQKEVIVKQRLEWVTLSDAGVAALIAMITYLSMRHLPALLEMILLQRLRMGAGERYATLAVIRYIVVTLGVVLTCWMLGVSWGSVQWLVAALTVGLGFGLQEIFANFISGLILLFERPIRVGDTVTMGTMTGKVTQIRTRSTVISDPDRKELIVPNKEFITGRIINWTLTDSVTRVSVMVNLAYGSDVEHAVAIMAQTLKDHPEVLKQPVPEVVCVGFGEAFMKFEARGFCEDVDTALRVNHELHVALEKALRVSGIAGFPQWAAPFRPEGK